MSKAIKCSRCGKVLNITEYVQNSRMILANGTEAVLHFCTCCIVVVDEGEKI